MRKQIVKTIKGQTIINKMEDKKMAKGRKKKKRQSKKEGDNISFILNKKIKWKKKDQMRQNKKE